MKKLLTILLLIALLVIGARMGAFDEAEEIKETRSHYQEIYGEKAKYFVFSK